MLKQLYFIDEKLDCIKITRKFCGINKTLFSSHFLRKVFLNFILIIL